MNFDEITEKYRDGHGCFIALEIKDKEDIKVNMKAGGDNNATLQAIAAAFIDIAGSLNKKPSDLLPFITERLVAESN